MYTKFIILLLLAIFSKGAFVQNEPKIDCGKTKFTCVCGIGDTKRYVPLEMTMYYVDDPVTGKAKCVTTEDPYKACPDVSCLLSTNKSVSPATNELISHFYPYVFTAVPSGDVKHRFTRADDPCHFPDIRTIVVRCWMWPDYIACNITCIYGHGFRDGTETMYRNCNYTEKIWKEGGFEDCEPYLNCEVRLKNPGELNCSVPHDAPPYCEISCYDYHEYKATERQKYECVDDSFGSNLPHCAALKDNVQVIPKPKTLTSFPIKEKEPDKK